MMDNTGLRNVLSGLRKRELVYVSLSILMLAVAVLAYLVGYLVAPAIFGKSWPLLSRTSLVLISLVGTLFFWLGLKGSLLAGILKLDNRLSAKKPYRVVRWIVIKTYSVVAAVVSIIFFAWINQTPKPTTSDPHQRERSADDIWDGSPHHYYDKDAPPPFK